MSSPLRNRPLRLHRAAPVMALLTGFALSLSPALAQGICGISIRALQESLVLFGESYQIAPDIDCETEATLPAHRLMCDSLYEDEQELWLMGNLDDAAWVYALENATGIETDHSNPSRDESFIAARDACTTEACLCEALIGHTNASLGGESPYLR
ncbi:hypothetical protein [Rhodobacter sp. 24-YEA-8]|uniref:hypothetical protein n=1 Tax=Rhodobacter sp. 24-YEA-8 TaxID=1884310 RepID=UPI000894F620|nr:hypothetical protein [Rhodobacter sp. 24-YEA-8]SEB52468.1 hypothetical protein SAMN05519105_0634 [Rhodobacter sp. 24-YEA-8]